MKKKKNHYVMCVSDQGDELSVLKGKVYKVLAPETKDGPNDIRVIDETGEDYLYKRAWFIEVELPQAVVKALEAA
jgi:hypothetical protein